MSDSYSRANRCAPFASSNTKVLVICRCLTFRRWACPILDSGHHVHVESDVVPPFIDITGQRFGRLVAVRSAFRVGPRTFWRCRCDCGHFTVVPISHLRASHTRSCGCLQNDTKTTHGRARSVEYQAWINLIQRCCNPKHPRYHDWGGRGIRVCNTWHQDFAAFLRDVGLKPKPHRKYILDRANNDGHYEPGNVQWVTRHKSGLNRRPTTTTRLP